MAKDPHGQATLESMSQAVWYNQWTLDKLKPYLKGDILEVGCGIGNFTRQLLIYGRVWAIDVQEDYLRELKKSLATQAEVGFGDIEKGSYFFKRRQFDTVVCLNVLEHIKNDQQALINLVKLLKPNGYLLLLVPSGMNLYGQIDRSIGHYRRYDKAELVRMIKKVGLKVEVARRLNGLGAIGWWVAGRVFKSAIVRRDQLQFFNLLAPIFLTFESWVEPPFGTSILTISRKR